jgi:hypothetical protein
MKLVLSLNNQAGSTEVSRKKVNWVRVDFLALPLIPAPAAPRPDPSLIQDSGARPGEEM